MSKNYARPMIRPPGRGVAPSYQPNNVGFDPFAGLFGGTATAQEALAAMPVPKPQSQYPVRDGIQGLVNRIGGMFRPRGQMNPGGGLAQLFNRRRNF